MAAGGGVRGFFLTGPPGVGKSTIFLRIVNEIKARGCVVGGIMAPEERAGGRRVGFRIVDLFTGRSGWLARAGVAAEGPRVGRYVVIVDDVISVGVAALRWAVENAHVIGIDEIGPMELKVPELREAIRESLGSGKPLVGVVHRRLFRDDPEIYRLVKSLGDIVEVSTANRDRLLAMAPQVAARIAREAGCGKGGEGPSKDT